MPSYDPSKDQIDTSAGVIFHNDGSATVLGRCGEPSPFEVHRATMFCQGVMNHRGPHFIFGGLGQHALEWTRYDSPEASDGRGGPHPLAGVPQAALDAAAEQLRIAVADLSDPDMVEPVAHAVLLAGLQEVKRARGD